MSKISSEPVLKIMLVGDAGVGKTSIMSTYFDIPFNDLFKTTIGIDVRQKIINMDGKTMRIQVWDTAGQERFRAISSNFYRGVMGIIIVYDVTKSKSFENLSEWLQNIQKNASEMAIKILVGNKCDSESQRVVSKSSGEELAKQLDVPFFEVSAKNNTNIENCIEKLIQDIVKSPSFESFTSDSISISETEYKQNKCFWLCGNCGGVS